MGWGEGEGGEVQAGLKLSLDEWSDAPALRSKGDDSRTRLFVQVTDTPTVRTLSRSSFVGRHVR